MRRTFKNMITLCLAMGLALAFSITAFAESESPYAVNVGEQPVYEYSLDIPTPRVHSMRSTNVYEKVSSAHPYVSPSKNTILTNYFLSTEGGSTITATNIIVADNPGKRSFSWQPGYGGVGTAYCLSAYPGVTGVYDAYNVEGTWAN